MERKITVVIQATGARYDFEGNYNTLADIKAKLVELNENVSDLEFMEGISKTKMVDDSSQLPKDVMRNGSPTNNLVFLASKVGKKIASGLSRPMLYESIKQLGLQEECKKRFGKNYTQLSNEDLKALIDNAVVSESSKKEDTTSKQSVDTSKCTGQSTSSKEENSGLKIEELLSNMEEVIRMLRVLSDKVDALERMTSSNDSSYDDEDYDDYDEEDEENSEENNDGYLSDRVINKMFGF